MVRGINWQMQNQVASWTSGTQPSVLSKSKDAAWPTSEVSSAQVPASACLCSPSEPLKMPSSFSNSLVSQAQAAPTPMKLNEHQDEDLVSKSIKWCEWNKRARLEMCEGEKWSAQLHECALGTWHSGKTLALRLEWQYSWKIFLLSFIFFIVFFFIKTKHKSRYQKQALVCLTGIAGQCI